MSANANEEDKKAARHVAMSVVFKYPSEILKIYGLRNFEEFTASKIGVAHPLVLLVAREVWSWASQARR